MVVRLDGQKVIVEFLRNHIISHIEVLSDFDPLGVPDQFIGFAAIVCGLKQVAAACVVFVTLGSGQFIGISI